MIEHVECHVLTEMDAMDSIVLSPCNGCCFTIQLLCHMLSLPDFFLQLPACESLSWLDPGYISDQASGGVLFIRWEYLQLVVHQVHFLWGDD